MKRNIAITMVMALVGVIAIIATIGLFSLNQATPAMAHEEDAPHAMVMVSPDDPGGISRMTVTFTTPSALNVGDEVIIKLEDDWKNQVSVPLDENRISIRSSNITGRGIDDTNDNTAPDASAAVRPAGVSVTLVGIESDEPEIRLQVPDMSTIDGSQSIEANSLITVIFNQGSGIINPTEGGKYNVTISATGIDPEAISGQDHLDNNDKPVRYLKDHVMIPAMLVLGSDGGARGKEITMVAKGVEGGESVTFWLDTNRDGERDSTERDLNCTSVAASDDTATCTVTLTNPPFNPGKVNYVNFRDSESRRIGSTDGTDTLEPILKEGGAIAGTGYTGAYPAISGLLSDGLLELEPLLDISPSTANTGDRVTFSLFDYVPGEITKIEIGNIGVALPIPVPVVPSSGEISFTFEIPSRGGDLGMGARIPTGKLRVDVHTAESDTDTNITIAGAQLSATATEVLANQDLTITGSGYTGTSNVEPACIRPGDITFNSVALEIVDEYDCPGADNRDSPGIELTSGGTFTITVRLREESENIPSALLTPGTHQLKVVDSEGTEGTTELTIPEREITVSPASARPRDVVTISGRNFVADNGDGSGVEVDVVYDCASDEDNFDVDPDSSGHFTDTLRIPNDCAIPSTNTITAEIWVEGSPTGIVETATHEIPNAEVSVSPGLGAPGSTFSVTGLGFRTFEVVEKVRIGDRTVVREGTGHATDRDGNLSISGILVPGLDAGIHPVIVEVGTDEERTTSSATFEVLEFGAPTAVPAAVMGAMEPLGDSLVRIFNFNNATKSWTFYDPRPDFADANTIDELFSGEVYWINVTEDTSAILNDKTRNLSCVEGDCWNQIVW